jgi:outer membrane lipoprotein-sorting protein
MNVSDNNSLRVPVSMIRGMALLAAMTLPLMGDPLSDTFAKMDRAAAKFKAMTADVVQTAHTAIINDDSISKGNVKFKRAKPGDTRILLEFTSPDVKFVSLEDDTGRMYIPKSRIVQEYDLRSRKNIVDQGLLLGFGATSAEIKAAYDVTWIGSEMVNGQPTEHIKLVPKSPEVRQSIKQADLWISDATGTPLQQRLVTSANGDYTQLTYSSVKLNPSLSDKDLKLNYPKGVSVEKVGK